MTSNGGIGPDADMDQDKSEPWDRGTIAGVHNYWLRGKDNYAADRTAADAINTVAPWLASGARASRAFLRRAVVCMADAGIDQFIDIGCGFPHEPNVHQIGQVRAPRARVVYVDNDPAVFVHVRARLATDERTIAIQADARRPFEIMTHPKIAETRHLDWTRPVGVLLVGVLEHLSGQEAADLTRAVREVSAPGSYLAITHLTTDRTAFEARGGKTGSGPDVAAWQRGTTAAAELYRATVGPVIPRDCERVCRFLKGYDVLRPGLVVADRWRAPGTRGLLPVPVLAGVGRRRTDERTSGVIDS